MSTIDFTPTAYTVKDPGNGELRRYEDSGSIADGRRDFVRLAEAYPNMARFVVPDHFVQEYCRAYDSSCWGGSGGYSLDSAGVFFRLAEKGLGQARFS